MPQQLGQISQGVVAFTESDAQPFLQRHTTGTGGLGFLILAPYTEQIAQQGLVVRFPVQSRLTSEPMLVSAVLLQRGATPVVRNLPAQIPAVEQVATQTIKILMYKDQVTGHWPDILQSPVKFIISQLECLQVCKSANCQCGRYHPKGSVDAPILDVWQRDTLTLHFQKCKAADSQIYAVAMRVTTDAFQQLSGMSGQHGVYIEPRTDDGKGQDPKYHTIWIPRLPLAEVRALQAMQKCPVSIVRVGHRYGLKAAAPDAEQVHRQITPEEPFIAGSSKLSFRVGPFPWGTTKKAIQQLFQQWGWAARAVHTIAKAKDASGLMWLVHASGPPASLVFQLQHGDVVIHQESAQPKEAWRPPQVQASAREKLERTNEPEFDPWADAAKLLPRADNISTAQLASMEASVEQRVMKKIQDQQQEVDINMSSAWEPRVAQLEQQLTAMQNRSTMVEGKLDMLHRQVDAQASKFEQALDCKLSDQMARIEALINKRARSSAHE